MAFLPAQKDGRKQQITERIEIPIEFAPHASNRAYLH